MTIKLDDNKAIFVKVYQCVHHNLGSGSRYIHKLFKKKKIKGRFIHTVEIIRTKHTLQAIQVSGQSLNYYLIAQVMDTVIFAKAKHVTNASLTENHFKEMGW